MCDSEDSWRYRRVSCILPGKSQSWISLDLPRPQVAQGNILRTIPGPPAVSATWYRAQSYGCPSSWCLSGVYRSGWGQQRGFWEEAPHAGSSQSRSLYTCTSGPEGAAHRWLSRLRCICWQSPLPTWKSCARACWLDSSSLGLSYSGIRARWTSRQWVSRGRWHKWYFCIWSLIMQ